MRDHSARLVLKDDFLTLEVLHDDPDGWKYVEQFDLMDCGRCADYEDFGEGRFAKLTDKELPYKVTARPGSGPGNLFIFEDWFPNLKEDLDKWVIGLWGVSGYIEPNSLEFCFDNELEAVEFALKYG